MRRLRKFLSEFSKTPLQHIRRPIIGYRSLVNLPSMFHSDDDMKHKLQGFEKQNTDSFSKSNYFLNVLATEAKIENLGHLHCEGCGIGIQTQDETMQGFLKKEKLIDIMNFNEKKKEQAFSVAQKVKSAQQKPPAEGSIERKGGTYDQIIPDELIDKRIVRSQGKAKKGQEYVEINDLETLQLLDEAIEKNERINYSDIKNLKKNRHFKPYLCQRCYELRSQSSLNETIRTELPKWDQETVLRMIFGKMLRKAYVFYLVDISDIYSTINNKIYEEVRAKNCRLKILVNKIDVLPHTVRLEAIKDHIRKTLKERNYDMLSSDIIFISAKTGQGYDKVIKAIEEIKTEKNNYIKKIYVLGHVNTGKSTFINKLISTTNKYGATPYPKYELTLTEEEKASFLKKEDNLTTSPYPGTTLDFVEVASLHLGVKLFDTPGIPTVESVSSVGEDKMSVASLLITSSIKPEFLKLEYMKSIWLGAIARLDLVKGDNLMVIVNCSKHVNIHKTDHFKANEVYLNQYGKLLTPVLHKDMQRVKFNKTELELNFDERGFFGEELEIPGLGWICFDSKQGRVHSPAIINLYLPEGVSFNLRRRLSYASKEEMKEKQVERVLRKTRLTRRMKRGDSETDGRTNPKRENKHEGKGSGSRSASTNELKEKGI